MRCKGRIRKRGHNHYTGKVIHVDGDLLIDDLDARDAYLHRVVVVADRASCVRRGGDAVRVSHTIFANKRVASIRNEIDCRPLNGQLGRLVYHGDSNSPLLICYDCNRKVDVDPVTVLV